MHLKPKVQHSFTPPYIKGVELDRYNSPGAGYGVLESRNTKGTRKMLRQKLPGEDLRSLLNLSDWKEKCPKLTRNVCASLDSLVLEKSFNWEFLIQSQIRYETVLSNGFQSFVSN